MGKKIRYRSVESVMDELKYLMSEYKVDEIFIEDDNFTVNKDRAIEILNRISELPDRPHLKFANGIRADRIDEELLKAMKKAGIYSISFGIESGCKKTLLSMKKNLDLERARTAVILAKAHGLLVGSNCIIGYPGETVNDIRESIDFFLSLSLDSMAIVNLIPFPGTEVRKVCEENSYLLDGAKNWDNYYFSINNPLPLIETPFLSFNELCNETRRAYRKMYMRPSWILKNISNLSLRQMLKGAFVILRGGKN
jgi:anaerobic magnesium-protoporphyrin IX monomethyl ester cyclase